MRRLNLLIAAPLALTACDSGKTVTAENASITEVAEAARGAAKFEPGKWETKVSFVSADAPGLPPQMADVINKQMAAQAEQTHSSCMTKEMADKPAGALFAGKDSGECRYERFEMGGGKIDAVMACKSPGGGGHDMRMVMSGTFSSAAYDMASEMKMTMPGAAGTAPMTIKTKVMGKRVGACDAPKV